MVAANENSKALVRASYELACRKFAVIDDFTPPARGDGFHQLRWHVALLVATGESDPRKIARAALSKVRQGEQVTRSMARVLGLADVA
jgi:hypothetical protein